MISVRAVYNGSHSSEERSFTEHTSTQTNLSHGKLRKFLKNCTLPSKKNLSLKDITKLLNRQNIIVCMFLCRYVLYCESCHNYSDL